MEHGNEMFGVRHVCVVVDGDGKPIACTESPIDGAAFARCLGYEAPLDAMRMVPVVEFSRKTGEGYER